MRSLRARVLGFAGLPMISMITPLLVLPVIGRVAGAGGWASLAAGEAIGTVAAIVVAWGWNTAGPPRIALTADPTERAQVYRESLVVRGALAVLCVPVVTLACVLVAAPSFALATTLMGFSATVTGLSFAWFAIGAGDPRSIAVYEAAPRVAAAALSAGLVVVTRELALYPVLAVTVSLGGIILFSRRTLAGVPAPRWSGGDVWRLLVRDRAIAVNDIAGGAYQSVPVPAVSLTAPAAAAGAYASADKLFKFGLYVPTTLANAFQSWTVEGHLHERRRRLRAALGAHVALGAVGAVVLAVLGPWVSGVMFGAEVAATPAVCLVLGLTFLVVSTRISLTRHVLVPAGRVRTVLTSTMLGAGVGVPAVVLLSLTVGPTGAAAGLLLGELVATGVLVIPALHYVSSLPGEARRAEAGT